MPDREQQPDLRPVVSQRELEWELKAKAKHIAVSVRNTSAKLKISLSSSLNSILYIYKKATYHRPILLFDMLYRSVVLV